MPTAGNDASSGSVSSTPAKRIRRSRAKGAPASKKLRQCYDIPPHDDYRHGNLTVLDSWAVGRYPVLGDSRPPPSTAWDLPSWTAQLSHPPPTVGDAMLDVLSSGDVYSEYIGTPALGYLAAEPVLTYPDRGLPETGSILPTGLTRYYDDPLPIIDLDYHVDQSSFVPEPYGLAPDTFQPILDDMYSSDSFAFTGTRHQFDRTTVSWLLDTRADPTEARSIPYTRASGPILAVSLRPTESGMKVSILLVHALNLQEPDPKTELERCNTAEKAMNDVLRAAKMPILDLLRNSRQWAAYSLATAEAEEISLPFSLSRKSAQDHVLGRKDLLALSIFASALSCSEGVFESPVSARPVFVQETYDGIRAGTLSVPSNPNSLLPSPLLDLSPSQLESLKASPPDL